jgi:hypothetical protein
MNAQQSRTFDVPDRCDAGGPVVTPRTAVAKRGSTVVNRGCLSPGFRACDR